MAFAIVTDCNEGQILVLEAVGCKRELYGDASRLLKRRNTQPGP